MGVEKVAEKCAPLVPTGNTDAVLRTLPSSSTISRLRDPG